MIDEVDKNILIIKKLLEEVKGKLKKRQVSKGNRLKSKAWICRNCRASFIAGEKVVNPAPCVLCEGIVFETVPVGTRLFNLEVCRN